VAWQPPGHEATGWQPDGWQPDAEGTDPPLLVGSIPNFSETENTGTHQYDLSAYFLGADTYAIAPAVETGWSFDTGTGVLEIDTDALGTFGPFIVTATNANGSTPSNEFTASVVAVAVVTEQPAGRARRRRPRRLVVEIDGQDFEVGSEAEARELLDRAKALAEQTAEQTVKREVKKAKRKKRAVAIAAPVIETSAPELKSLVSQYRDDIEAIYQRMAIDAEISALLRKKLRDEDEDDEDAIAVLLLH
jgi:hypothetical protein